MRWVTVVALAFTLACDGRERLSVAEPAEPPPAPIDDLQFYDPQLQLIATRLLNEARARRIDSVRATGNAAERLIALEAALGAPPAALSRVNAIVLRSSSTDATEWAIIRAKANARCESRDDAACLRVVDLVQRWQRHKSKIIMDQLANRRVIYAYGGQQWERFFYQFIKPTPRDAATWGWLLLRDREPEVHRQYGEANAEKAYRYYLALTGFAHPREATDVFSVPGVEIE